MSKVAIFSNPIRRRRRKVRRNSSRRKRSGGSRTQVMGYTVGGARIRRRKMNPIRHHRRRRRNPIGGEIGQVLTPALIGAAGALGINVLLGYASFLPATFQTGYGRAGVQVAAGLAVGALGPKMGLSRNTSYAIATGVTIIAAYDVISTLVASKFPNVNLGENFTMLPAELATPANQAGYGELYRLPPSAANNYVPSNTFG